MLIVVFGVLLTCIVSLSGDSEKEDTYSYTYHDYSTSQVFKSKGKGDRLVNAAAVEMNEFPFVGAFFLAKKSSDESSNSVPPTCTASLISERYVLTAAHCFFLPGELDGKDCKPGVKIKVSKESLKDVLVECEVTREGDVKMWLRDERFILYLLFGAVQAQRIKGQHSEGIAVDVDHLIRHKHSHYQDVDMGGYDILLVKLKESLSIPSACLPSEEFKDTLTVARLAGYGNYFRQNCLTSSQGPMKAHYCLTKKECLADPFKRNCEPDFFDNSNVHYIGCQKDGQSPAQYSRLCSKFVRQSGLGAFPNSVDDIHLIYLPKDSNKGQFLETCYRADGSDNGWCRTNGDFYNSKKVINTTTALTSDYGWGFCSKDCKQDWAQVEKGVLRKIMDADVMTDEYCQDFLKQGTQNQNGVFKTVKPKVVCVGRNNSIKYRVYFTSDPPEGNSTRWGLADDSWLSINPQIIDQVYKQNNLDPKSMKHYISSVGSCYGDSGGPMFQDIAVDGIVRRHVLLGVVSGGRGELGNCGGIHNPTLYTRVKKFVSWIKTASGGNETFCIVNNATTDGSGQN